MLLTHAEACPPPVGRGYSADDLQEVELARLEAEFAKVLPQLLQEGIGVLVDQIKHEQALKALQRKVLESLAPEFRKRAMDLFRSRAEAQLKAEAEAALKAETLAKAESVKPKR